MQAEALETLVNNHYKGLITAIASHIQDKVEANIREWLTAEFRHQLEHHEVAFAQPTDEVKEHAVEQIVEAYLKRNNYMNDNNIDAHIQEYVQNNDIVTADSLSDSINEWMSENFDISDYDIEYPVKEAVRNLEFSVEVQVN